MRSEQEMLQLILDVARDDERIRAVLLNGSRANPSAPRDIFQDFDVVYLVTDVAPFKRNFEWIRRFGELMILQMPDDMGDPLPTDRPGYAYLMQFADGNRIDLSLFPADHHEEVTADSLTVLLLDKDEAVGPLPPPSDRDYWPRPPTEKQFADCCNEFWWVCPYVAKGLWRQEPIYARFMLEQVLRVELMKMLTWSVGVQTDFSRNLGSFGRYLHTYIEPGRHAQLERTYADDNPGRAWEALFAMGGLFRAAAREVADHFGYDYPEDDDRRVSAHLRHVRSLPKDATAID